MPVPERRHDCHSVRAECELRRLIEEYAETLKVEAHQLGDHGLTEQEFYNSGLFRGAIERIRGQFAATMREKREFVKHVLNHMQDHGHIKEWESAGEANRHDYAIHMPSGRTAVVELKGCLDGNNTNIFERPPHANEFVVWSVCTNAGADPRHNVWSGIHTRLSAEIISRNQLVDGAIVWDMVCGTLGRPCPKVKDSPERMTEVGPYNLPPPCLYLFPATIPSPRNNPKPNAQPLANVHFLQALHDCFGGQDSEINHVDIEVEYQGTDTVRKRGSSGVEPWRENRSSPPFAGCDCQAIEKQLNRIELANRFTRAVAVGNPREFTQAEKEEQEIAEACNRLIRNSIICWNYLYLARQLKKAPDAETRKTYCASPPRALPCHGPTSTCSANTIFQRKNCATHLESSP